MSIHYLTKNVKRQLTQVGGSEGDSVCRSGILRVRTQLKNQAIDLPDVQTLGAGLAQDLDNIRRLKEPNRSRELALIDPKSNLGSYRKANERSVQLGHLPSIRTMAC